jgi:hypothetical protein
LIQLEERIAESLIFLSARAVSISDGRSDARGEFSGKLNTSAGLPLNVVRWTFVERMAHLSSARSELREMLPTWAVVVLLPTPMITFWHVGAGRDFAYAYLFLGCAILAAERFSGTVCQGGPGGVPLWRAKVTALVLAMAAAVIVFTAFAWAIIGRPDALVLLLAALAVVPALCCVPFLAVVTGRPYAAVLFAAVLLTTVKLAGCVVAVIVYGWNAQAEGHLTLPWERPNLLVWLCLAGTMAMSAVMYQFGRRAFLTNRMPPGSPSESMQRIGPA